ncbi:hypothetical protein DXX93_05780 [Thalassotalea euphylliae]|uniref:Uncharacterized protein n=1 Tax=Thalassotalea euphylliae TaxID=1655234 RepID=A0A3E0TNJ5_9GAMM|nr:DUF6170 family protein [Thalassotalea euphylliae]REL26136.1 hypothetical protein DXX93_05780 [Thalassotalea euphylliae]
MLFSTNQLTELEQFSLTEKHAIMHIAHQHLSVPEKLVLNLIKLLLLIPPFIYLARQDWWALALAALISTAGYVLVMRPVSIHFSKRHLKTAIAKFTANTVNNG